jgi:hypothetical protein
MPKLAGDPPAMQSYSVTPRANAGSSGQDSDRVIRIKFMQGQTDECGHAMLSGIRGR